MSEPWLNTLTGTRIRIRTKGSDTDNRLTIIEYVEPPNSAPPIFTRHEFVEVFCVQSGVLTFQFLDEKQVEVTAGQNMICPSWKPHSFWNESNEPASVLLVCTPAGLDEFFIESNNLLAGAQINGALSQTDDMAKAMKALRTKYGLEHVGTPPSN